MPTALRPPARWTVKPDQMQVNWGHPLTDRLVRAYLFHNAAGTSVGNTGYFSELVYGYPIAFSGVVLNDEDGKTYKSLSSEAAVDAHRADLTPASGQGNGGFSICAGFYKTSASVADQICSMYAGTLEYVYGCTSGAYYCWFYDSLAGVYSGRSGPVPAAGVWHNCAITWNGAVQPKDNLQLWTDAIRVDTTDFSGGTFASCVDGTTALTLCGFNGGLGGTNSVKLRYLYIFRRGLFPDEVAWIHDDPYALLVQPQPQACFKAAAVAGSSATGGFFFG
jgi:hypothetical protein